MSVKGVYIVLPFGSEELANLVRSAIEREMGYIGAVIPGELLPELDEAYAVAARRRDAASTEGS